MHQARKCRLVSSGPLSHRIACGVPRSATIPSNTRVTRRLAKLVSTSNARHSRVYASTTLSTRIALRFPLRRARSPAPTPGSPRCRPVAAVRYARSVCASCAGYSAPLPDIPDAPVCGSHLRRCVAAIHASADSRIAASRATPPAAVATLHRCACFDNGNWIPPPSADGTPAAR